MFVALVSVCVPEVPEWKDHWVCQDSSLSSQACIHVYFLCDSIIACRTDNGSGSLRNPRSVIDPQCRCSVVVTFEVEEISSETPDADDFSWPSEYYEHGVPDLQELQAR